MDRDEIKNIAGDIRTQISENNKEKKQAYELKQSGVSCKEKANAQNEIKQLADKAKEEQKIADGYDKIATGAGSNHDKFNTFNDKYQDHVLKAQSHNIDKQAIANDIRKKLGRGNVSEACECFMNCLEVNREAAQKVVDRKVEQLKKSSDEMNQSKKDFKNAMDADGIAVMYPGDVSKTTDLKSSWHRHKIEQGNKLNNGALRILKAGKKYGADVDNLRYAGKGHSADVQANAKAHHDIKHQYD